MEPCLPHNAVLSPTPWCVVRQQEQEHLIYNSRTDEMHLLPRSGFYAYELCDGLRTVVEIEEALGQMMHTPDGALGKSLTGFLGKLIDRGILQIEGYAH